VNRGLEIPQMTIWALDGWLSTPFALAALAGMAGTLTMQRSKGRRRSALGAGLFFGALGFALTVAGLYGPLM
jgi:hypothetical protein